MPWSSSLVHHHYRKYCLQISDVFAAFNSIHPLVPESANFINQPLFGFWFDNGLQEKLQLMPEKFNWVQIQALGRRLPTVDVFLLHDGAAFAAGVFQVVILL